MKYEVNGFRGNLGSGQKVSFNQCRLGTLSVTYHVCLLCLYRLLCHFTPCTVSRLVFTSIFHFFIGADFLAFLPGAFYPVSPSGSTLATEPTLKCYGDWFKDPSPPLTFPTCTAEPSPPAGLPGAGVTPPLLAPLLAYEVALVSTRMASTLAIAKAKVRIFQIIFNFD